MSEASIQTNLETNLNGQVFLLPVKLFTVIFLRKQNTADGNGKKFFG